MSISKNINFPIILIIEGGLGNQLFQAAFALVLSKRFKTKVILLSLSNAARTSRKCELEYFGFQVISPPYIVARTLSLFLKTLRKFRIDRIIKKIVFERPFISDIYDNKPLIVNGYWQRVSNYQGGVDDLKLACRDLSNEFSDFTSKLDIFDESCLALHVRRGDFITDIKASSIHNICGISYYDSAVNKALMMNPKIERIIIFSDDIDWAKENLSYPVDTLYVRPNNDYSWVDMVKMSKCGSFIICNSSYSFWAATLSSHSSPLKIAPFYWFRDVKTSSLDLLGDEWNLVEL